MENAGQRNDAFHQINQKSSEVVTTSQRDKSSGRAILAKKSTKLLVANNRAMPEGTTNAMGVQTTIQPSIVISGSGTADEDSKPKLKNKLDLKIDPGNLNEIIGSPVDSSQQPLTADMVPSIEQSTFYKNNSGVKSTISPTK